MAKANNFLLSCCCLALLLAIFDETTRAQTLPFSLDGADNECYVQCPMDECPELNLDMVDCVVYCKAKCACPADDAECATKAMDEMQKAADERESVIGPDVGEAAESPESETADISLAGASDSDAAFAPESSVETTSGDMDFAAEDGGSAFSPDAFAPEIDTTSFVIEMDASSSPSDGAPSPAQYASAPEEAQYTVAPAGAATPRSSAPAAAPTPTGATTPIQQNAASPGPTQQNAASPGPTQRNAAAAPSSRKAAPGPNAPAPASG